MFSSETDWSGNWWIVAGLTAAVAGAAMGAALSAGAGALWSRMQVRARP